MFNKVNENQIVVPNHFFICFNPHRDFLFGHYILRQFEFWMLTIHTKLWVKKKEHGWAKIPRVFSFDFHNFLYVGEFFISSWTHLKILDPKTKGI